MGKNFQRLSVIFLSLASLALSLPGVALGQRIKVDRRTITPNKPTPELYSDSLALKVTLMNLPGAETPGSSLEVEYKVYFVPEQSFEAAMRQLKREGRARELKPEYFPDKILLAEGRVGKDSLRTLEERTTWRRGIGFKRKVPSAQQTSFSSIITFYSVKVYDARLKKAVYGSDAFIAPPFDTESGDRDNFSPATALYLNFYVADNGDLYKSNRKGASESTEWRPR